MSRNLVDTPFHVLVHFFGGKMEREKTWRKKEHTLPFHENRWENVDGFWCTKTWEGVSCRVVCMWRSRLLYHDMWVNGVKVIRGNNSSNSPPSGNRSDIRLWVMPLWWVFSCGCIWPPWLLFLHWVSLEKWFVLGQDYKPKYCSSFRRSKWPTGAVRSASVYERVCRVDMNARLRYYPMWCDVMWCDVMWCDVMWCDGG